jgi:hypothetical protein
MGTSDMGPPDQAPIEIQVATIGVDGTAICDLTPLLGGHPYIQLTVTTETSYGFVHISQVDDGAWDVTSQEWVVEVLTPEPTGLPVQVRVSRPDGTVPPAGSLVGVYPDSLITNGATGLTDSDGYATLTGPGLPEMYRSGKAMAAVTIDGVVSASRLFVIDTLDIELLDGDPDNVGEWLGVRFRLARTGAVMKAIDSNQITATIRNADGMVVDDQSGDGTVVPDWSGNIWSNVGDVPVGETVTVATDHIPGTSKTFTRGISATPPVTPAVAEYGTVDDVRAAPTCPADMTDADIADALLTARTIIDAYTGTVFGTREVTGLVVALDGTGVGPLPGPTQIVTSVTSPAGTVLDLAAVTVLPDDGVSPWRIALGYRRGTSMIVSGLEPWAFDDGCVRARSPYPSVLIGGILGSGTVPYVVKRAARILALRALGATSESGSQIPGDDGSREVTSFSVEGLSVAYGQSRRATLLGSATTGLWEVDAMLDAVAARRYTWVG